VIDSKVSLAAAGPAAIQLMEMQRCWLKAELQVVWVELPYVALGVVQFVFDWAMTDQPEASDPAAS
jgi:hypothetical protein